MNPTNFAFDVANYAASDVATDVDSEVTADERTGAESFVASNATSDFSTNFTFDVATYVCACARCVRRRPHRARVAPTTPAMAVLRRQPIRWGFGDIPTAIAQGILVVLCNIPLDREYCSVYWSPVKGRFLPANGVFLLPPVRYLSDSALASAFSQSRPLWATRRMATPGVRPRGSPSSSGRSSMSSCLSSAKIT